MPYTGHPLTIDRDAVRHMIGDKDNEDLLLTDEEIDFHLAEHGDNKLLAAAECAEAIAAMPRMQQPQAGDSGGTPVTRADHYLRLARQLRSREVVVERRKKKRTSWQNRATALRPYIEEHCSNGRRVYESDFG